MILNKLKQTSPHRIEVVSIWITGYKNLITAVKNVLQNWITRKIIPLFFSMHYRESFFVTRN